MRPTKPNHDGVFDPNEILLQVTDQDAITYRDAFESFLILGGTGCGKTSGPGDLIARTLLERKRNGFLVLCAKSDECSLWLKRAERAGRLSDVRRFAVDQPHRLNLLNYAFHQPGASRGGSDPQNVVELLMRLLEVKPERSSSSGDHVFFISSGRQLLTSVISILGAAGEEISFANINSVIDSAPYSPGDFTNQKWAESSFLSFLFDKMAKREKELSPIQQNDARVALEYFAWFARMDDRTRSGIVATVQSIIWPFRFGAAAELCGSNTNLTPEDIFHGRIVILDLPIKQYFDTGLMIQTAWKLLFQRAVEARDLNKYPSPVVLYADEGHNFLTSYDSTYQSSSRSMRAITVFLSQNLDSLRAKFPSQNGDAEVQALISNLNTKLLCANDHAQTNKWAADTIGELWLTRSNRGHRKGCHKLYAKPYNDLK